MKLKDIKDELGKFYEPLKEIDKLRPCQEKAIKAGIFKEKSILICTPTASGKCLHYSSRVLLSDGQLIKIGELYEKNLRKINILSLDENDLKIKKRDVSCIYKIYHNKHLLEIRTGLGNKIRVTPEHPFLVKRSSDLEWIEAQDLKTDDFFVVPRTTTTYPNTFKFNKNEMFQSFSNCYVKYPELLYDLILTIKKPYRYFS